MRLVSRISNNSIFVYFALTITFIFNIRTIVFPTNYQQDDVAELEPIFFESFICAFDWGDQHPLFSGFVTKSLIMDATAKEHYPIIWAVLVFASAGVLSHSGIKIPYFTFFFCTSEGHGITPSRSGGEGGPSRSVRRWFTLPRARL